MWKINELFIKLQLAAGKVFYASHNPANADGEFAKEVEFLLREGYRFIQEGEIWKFIK